MLKQLSKKCTGSFACPETIGRTCNDSEDFVLIGDEATDVSTHEQVSVCERFVECTGGNSAVGIRSLILA
jgi:hypothetical protein